MQDTRIHPEKISKPIQLLAAWFAALVLLVGSLLIAAANISQPNWLSIVLVFAAILIIPFFAYLIFKMQTKHRVELLEGKEYIEYTTMRFENFNPENLQLDRKIETEYKYTGEQLEDLRISKYEENRGVFLVHSWRPSKTPGQVADIAIYLRQHNVVH